GFEVKVAGRIVVRVQITEDQVGISDGGLGSASSVAGRSGIGAGGVGTNFDRSPQAVVPRDRASARAERAQVYHRRRHPPTVDDRLEVINPGTASLENA